MKVLWFSNTSANAEEFLGSGTVGGGWLKSLDKVLQSEVDLHVAFYYPRKDDSFKYLDTHYYPIKTKGWKLKAILKRIWREFLSKQDLPRYLDIINKVKPDIIHIHGTENPFGCIIPYIQIPVIVSIQGCITVSNHKFNSGFSLKYLREIIQLRDQSIKEFLLKDTFMQSKKNFERMARREQVNLNCTKYIMGRTQWDKRITSVLAPESEYFHCDEMMRSVFHTRKWKHQASKKLILHSTNGNSPFKGFETLCETLFELNRIVGAQVEWRVAGISDNDDIVKITKKKLKSRFPNEGLLLLGRISEDILAEKMCEAHIYISPSHIENSPNSLCEAMLLGMPCIATFAGGTGSLLKDREEGILIQDGDPWVMAGAIVELYKDPELAIHFGMKARERAQLRHNPEKILDDLKKIYGHIVGIKRQ